MSGDKYIRVYCIKCRGARVFESLKRRGELTNGKTGWWWKCSICSHNLLVLSKTKD